MSARLERIVERMRVQPTYAILEVGCGHGIAADHICQRLVGGHFVAIDRSPKMIAAAVHRNARHVAAGTAEFIIADFESFDPGSRRFDVILAIRVGLFHREPRRARSIASRWLKPNGKIVAEFDEPQAE
jgi:ubiquinone/menaquinone biosynthesis C-methylase UbiE